MLSLCVSEASMVVLLPPVVQLASIKVRHSGGRGRMVLEASSIRTKVHVLVLMTFATDIANESSSEILSRHDW